MQNDWQTSDAVSSQSEYKIKLCKMFLDVLIMLLNNYNVY